MEHSEFNEKIGNLYDKVAPWWTENHFQSNYGIAQVSKAISYCKNHRKALDVGCGSGGRIINKLLENKFQIAGIDASQEMIKSAKKNHPEVSFLCRDIREWESKDKYDLIIAWDSIFHLPSDEQEPVVARLCNYLNTDGILIYTFGDDYGDHQSLSFQDENGKQIGELNNDLFPYGTIGINENLRVIMKNGCQCRHLELDQYPAKHVYLIAKKLK